MTSAELITAARALADKLQSEANGDPNVPTQIAALTLIELERRDIATHQIPRNPDDALHFAREDCGFAHRLTLACEANHG